MAFRMCPLNVGRIKLTRFEYLLLASMGEKFIDRHTFAGQTLVSAHSQRSALEKLAKAGFGPTGYDPLHGGPTSTVVHTKG
jgi:hypothetical protein